MKAFAKQMARSLTRLSGSKARVVSTIAGREASFCIKWHCGKARYFLGVCGARR